MFDKRRLALGAAKYATNRCAIELLKVRQGFRHHFSFQFNHAGSRNHFPGGRAYLVVTQLLGIQALRLLHLRNNPVATACNAEVVDVTAAQHAG